MFRPDNSFDSANNPISGNIYTVKEYGMHKGIIVDIKYTDDSENRTAETSNPRVLYTVQVVGGERDGQLFSHAENMQTYGGILNFSERTWKKTSTLLRVDIANPLNLEEVPVLNGDVVYLMFINGDLKFPVIVGGAKHSLDGSSEADSIERSVSRSQFNGIYTEINKDGEFYWAKDNGIYSPIPIPDPTGSAFYLQEQFVPFPGFQDAVEVTLGNEFDFIFKMNVLGTSGMEVAIDGLADTFSVTTLLGSGLEIDGLGDSISLSTFTGAAISVNGFTDSIELSSFTGASVLVDGFTDTVEISTTAGAGLSVSGFSGVELKDALGDSLSLSNAAVELKNATGAAISFDQAGFIKLGNATGDVLQILGEAFQALATQTAVGFNAPTSTVAVFAQLLIKLKLISG